MILNIHPFKTALANGFDDPLCFFFLFEHTRSSLHPRGIKNFPVFVAGQLYIYIRNFRQCFRGKK